MNPNRTISQSDAGTNTPLVIEIHPVLQWLLARLKLGRGGPIYSLVATSMFGKVPDSFPCLAGDMVEIRGC